MSEKSLNPFTLLDEVEKLEKNRGLDLLFEEVDDELYRCHPGPWPRIDVLLENATGRIDTLSMTNIVGLLTITLPIRGKSTERPRFYAAAVERAKRDGRDVKRLLGGLE